jgi:hypothetical protein
MLQMPNNVHSHEAYQCQELAEKCWRLGRYQEADFWWGIRDAKFQDALNADDARAEARSRANVSNARKRLVAGYRDQSAIGTSDGMTNGQTATRSPRMGDRSE